MGEVRRQASEEGNSEMCGAAKLGIREKADALKHPRPLTGMGAIKHTRLKQTHVSSLPWQPSTGFSVAIEKASF